MKEYIIQDKFFVLQFIKVVLNDRKIHAVYYVSFQIERWSE